MKRILLGLLILVYSNLLAQNKAPQNIGNSGATSAAAVGSIAVVAIAAAMAYEQYIEILELQATQQFLKDYPNSRNFSIKLLSDQITSLKDLSNTSTLAFRITEWELINGQIGNPNRRIMLLLLSGGWATEYGIDFTYVKKQYFDVMSWNKLYFNYINTQIYPKKQDINNITGVKRVQLKQFNEHPGRKFIEKNLTSLEDEHFIELTYPISSLFKITKNQVLLDVPTFEPILIGRKIPVDTDTYFSFDYDESLKIICNENRLGLYDVQLNNLVQISNKGIYAIHKFLNNIQ